MYDTYIKIVLFGLNYNGLKKERLFDAFCW